MIPGCSRYSTTGWIDTSETLIITDQVEYHPHRGQPQLLEFRIDENIMLTVYNPLDVGTVMDGTKLATIGNRYGETAPQAAIRRLLRQEMVRRSRK